jgi:hypothetical protein
MLMQSIYIIGDKREIVTVWAGGNCCDKVNRRGGKRRQH